MELKNIIKHLVQQCNIEAISLKDLSKELTNLYNQVESHEIALKSKDGEISRLYDDYKYSKELLADYKRKYVDPVEVLKSNQLQFEKEKFKFEVEKEYMKREVSIYKEIVASLTTVHSRYDEHYGGNNNCSYNSGMKADKPNLPHHTKFGETNNA